jgi:hypothetical protein
MQRVVVERHLPNHVATRSNAVAPAAHAVEIHGAFGVAHEMTGTGEVAAPHSAFGPITILRVGSA